MARIPYFDEAGPGADPQLISEIEARRGGQLLNLDRMLLHSAPLARGWNQLLGAVRRQTALPGDLRELAILRVAVLNRAPYEFFQHAPEARSEGVSEDKISAVKGEALGAPFTDAERLVLEYTDAMTKDVQVPQPLFDAVRQQFGDRQLVELTLTIAAYNMVSRFLEALGIEPETPA